MAAKNQPHIPWEDKARCLGEEKKTNVQSFAERSVRLRFINHSNFWALVFFPSCCGAIKQPFLFFVANTFSHSPRCPPSPFLIASVFSLPLVFFFALPLSLKLYIKRVWAGARGSLAHPACHRWACQSAEGLSESGLTGNISLETQLTGNITLSNHRLCISIPCHVVLF